MKEKIGILSLGCPRNLVDSENILGRLRLKRHPVVDIEQADVAIVNTCAFIDEAKRESIDAILDLIELKKKGSLKKIIVYGCLPERYGRSLERELPEVDAFVGKVSLNHSRGRYGLTPKHYAYLKICEGCLSSCSFCVIPKIKGKLNSLPMRSVLDKAADFDRSGIAELNIIGQDTSGYGVDLYGEPKLACLLEKILRKARHIGWVRLLYLQPERINDKLLRVIRDHPQVCRYIDLPIQHCNGRILKLMGRKSKGKGALMELIEKVRKIIPGVALRTSIIAGFPSETEREFKELLGFIKAVGFERLGAFTYSREEGTVAYNFAKQVPEKAKAERLDAVMSLQQEVSARINAKFLGKTLKVLVDEKQPEGYLGRSEYDAPEVDGLVYISSKRKLQPGDFIRVKIIDTYEYDLVGEEL